jgi:hypothetical protein
MAFTGDSFQDKEKFCNLVLVDQDSLSYALFDKSSLTPVCLKYFYCGSLGLIEHEDSIREVLNSDEVLKEDFETVLVYGFPYSCLVPDAYFEEELGAQLLNFSYGTLDRAKLRQEKVPWWDLHNVYRIPVNIEHLFSQRFDNSKKYHFYSLLLKSHKKYLQSGQKDILDLIFYRERMVVSAYKSDHLQILQNFDYEGAEDVVYNLLNCSSRFAYDQEQVRLQLSGFIEKNSAIYHELAKYFTNISFQEMGLPGRWNKEQVQFPEHFFSTLLNLTSCV